MELWLHVWKPFRPRLLPVDLVAEALYNTPDRLSYRAHFLASTK
jgi:hypothetical protein